MTTIFKSTGITIAGLPKLYRDKTICAGTQYLFDFEDPYCNPHTRGAALSNGAVFRNLVDGSSATLFGTSMVNGAAGKGVKLPGINDNGIDFGTGYTTAQDAYLVILWLCRRTGDTPTANSFIFGKCSSITLGNYFAYRDGGNIPSVTLGLNGSLGSSVNCGTAFMEEVPEQIAFMFNGDDRSGYRNGVLQNTFANAAATSNTGTFTEGIGRKTTAGLTTALGFNTGWQGSVLRASKENLTTFSASASARQAWANAQVAADYTNNLARFS